MGLNVSMHLGVLPVSRDKAPSLKQFVFNYLLVILFWNFIEHKYALFGNFSTRSYSNFKRKMLLRCKLPKTVLNEAFSPLYLYSIVIGRYLESDR